MIATLHAHVLVDAGPLIAILDEQDAHHDVCVATLDQIKPPLMTTWPVIAEVAWLLRHREHALQRLYTGARDGLVGILPLDEVALLEFSSIARRFQSLRLQIADMSLLYFAEQQAQTTIFTLDRRDFDVIRKKSRRRIVLLPE